jgi:hypothetical protein
MARTCISSKSEFLDVEKDCTQFYARDSKTEEEINQDH